LIFERIETKRMVAIFKKGIDAETASFRVRVGWRLSACTGPSNAALPGPSRQVAVKKTKMKVAAARTTAARKPSFLAWVSDEAAADVRRRI